jgi:DNA-binding NarL/FixJ family response regulator
MFVEALRALLEKTNVVLGTVLDGRAMVTEALRLRPDVIVAGISMPLLDGFDGARKIKLLAPNIKFVFLTMLEDPNLAAAPLSLAQSVLF